MTDSESLYPKHASGPTPEVEDARPWRTDAAPRAVIETEPFETTRADMFGQRHHVIIGAGFVDASVCSIPLGTRWRPRVG